MTTLIAVYGSDGLVGRCDAKCYKAKHQGCTCVCGGRNHGVGLEAAVENTKEIVEYWKEMKELGMDIDRVEVNDDS